MKIKIYPRGRVSFENTGALYAVKVYKGEQLHDQVRLEERRIACEYYKAFKAIARN
jgi:hypothetical protein